MTVTHDGIATRADLERALWWWSGWRADQPSVDALLELIDRYAVPARRDEAATILARARNEAAQIVQSARDEAALVQTVVHEGAQRPPDGLRRLAPGAVPVEAFTDAAGAVWVRVTAPRPDAPTGHRKCRGCGLVKMMAGFQRDPKCKDGYRYVCSVCYNAARREREGKKRKVSQGVRS